MSGKFWSRVDSRAVRERVCPYCGAERGSKCVSKGGHTNPVPHVGRTLEIYEEELALQKLTRSAE